MKTSSRRYARLAAVLALVVGAFAAPARAEDAAAKPPAGAYVVIVGVGTFDKDDTIKPRPTAEADAKAFHKLMTDAKYFPPGGPHDPSRVKLLLTKEDAETGAKLASRDAIVKSVEDAVAATGKDDLIILAFFGRGASAGDKTCFFTAETVFKDRAKTGLLGSDLEASLKKLKGQKLLYYMDVSFKGFEAGKEKLAEPNLTDILTSIFGGEDKDDNALPMDRVFMLGSIPSQDPLSKDGHSLFSALVLEGLKGKADVEGYSSDGLVTVDELVKFLDKTLPDATRALGVTDKEKEARPFFSGVATSHFPITRNPAETATVDDRLKKLDRLAEAKSLTPEESAEGKVLLTRMPKLKAQQELRKAYEKLVDGTLDAQAFEKARTDILEGLKVDEAITSAFVSKVNDAISLVRSRYIKDLSSADMTVNAIRGMYRRIEATLPKDLEESLKDTKGMSRERLNELLGEARKRLGKREDLDGDKDADVAIMMMLNALNDPYTTYIDREGVRKMESQFRGQFSGIGIRIAPDLVRDGLLVVSPIKGSPAYKAGIQAGDLIVEIRRTVDNEGKQLKPGDKRVFSTKGMKIDEALDIILGKPGTPITVVVERDGDDSKKQTLVKDLTRDRVNVETILGVKRLTALGKKDDWDFFIDEANKIAYIHMTQFAPSTYTDLKRAIDSLKETGMKGLVLDLRFNPGGLLRTAVFVCDLFMDDGTIVSIRPRVGEEEKYGGQSSGSELGFPMVVLVNGLSASASEIVSACLQDHSRAVVMGERSFGKGSVQQVEDFKPTGGQIKLTTARYYPPGNKNIDKLATGGKPEDQWGVTPDKGFDVKLTREERGDLAEALRDLEVIGKKEPKEKKETKPFKDKQLDQALDYLRGQIKTANVGTAKKGG